CTSGNLNGSADGSHHVRRTNCFQCSMSVRPPRSAALSCSRGSIKISLLPFEDEGEGYHLDMTQARASISLAEGSPRIYVGIVGDLRNLQAVRSGSAVSRGFKTSNDCRERDDYLLRS